MDLFPNATQDALDEAARQPAISMQTTPGEAFSAAYDASARFGNILSGQQNMADAAQDSLDAFQAKTGEKLPNPYAFGFNPIGWDIGKQMDQLAQVRARTQAKATELNDPSLAFPDEDTLYAAGVQKARAAMGAQARAGQGQQAFGTGIAGMAGGFLASNTDPMNLGLNGIAIATMPEGGGIVRSLFGAGLNFGAQGAAEEAATYGYKQTVNPDYGPGDAAMNVASSALGGVAMEAGGKALGALWRRVRPTPLADALPQPVRDAAISAERTADIDAQSPFKTGLDGGAANADTFVKIESDLLNEREPTLPTSAMTEGEARVGDVQVPQEPSPLALVDQHARATNPDLFGNVDDLDNQIAQTRGSLGDILDRRNAQPDLSGSQVQPQIDALQQQLASFTGKRKASPSAQAVRDQIDALQQASGGLTADQGARDAQQEQFLRGRLNDLQNDRARLGPDVSAARDAAADQLGMPNSYAQAIDAVPSHSGRPFEPVEPPEMPADDGAQAAQQPDADAASQPAPRRARRAKAEPPAPVTPAEAARGRAAVSVDQATGRQPSRAFFGNRSVRVKYELAEAGDLVTSHDNDFRVNPAYPTELQPRDRSSAPSRDQVLQMAQKLQPERLGPSPEANAGAPIVGPDGVVESGNGRTMAIRQAYSVNSEASAAYRAFLERSGFDTSNMVAPVLVGRRVTPLSAGDRAAFAHAANGSASLRMSATEQALSDARLIDHPTAALLQPGAVNSVANRDFVRALVSRMPEGERGSIMTKAGTLSAGGVNRLKAALVARAYGDADLVARAFDAIEPGIKTIAAALTDASPEWIAMRDAVARGDIKAGQDITDDMLTAVRAIMRAKDERLPVGAILSQSDMFASDQAALAARLFYRDGSLTRFLSRADMADNLSTFARDTVAQRGLGDNLFGEPPAATAQVLAGTVRHSEARQAAIAAALKPEAIEKAVSDPKVLGAAEADLGRQIEQGLNRVPIEAADGSVSLGFADKELAGINDELNAAAEVRACSDPIAEAAE